MKKVTLPMGWKEVEPAGSQADAGTPEDELASTAYPRNPRIELHRWVRGDRYVRVCREAKNLEFPYAVHYGWLDKVDKPDSIPTNTTSLSFAIVKAKNLMRMGGYRD